MSETSFDDLTDVYEAMIDWAKRLNAEAPFFRRLFEKHNVKRVADVACGTGRHAAMFHSWGLEVEGSDISPNMIDRARETFREPAGLRWAVRGFDQPPGPQGSFDVVICVGNSLALAADVTAATRALRHMFGATRCGGVVIVHVLNLWTFPSGPCVWQKMIRCPSQQAGAVILKGVHRCGEQGYVELVVINDPAVDPPTRSRSVHFLGLKSECLETIARENGATEVTFFGGYQNQPYDTGTSNDLIMVARKERIAS